MTDLDHRIAALTRFRNLVLVIIIAVPLAHVAVKGLSNIAYEVRASR